MFLPALVLPETREMEVRPDHLRERWSIISLEAQAERSLQPIEVALAAAALAARMVRVRMAALPKLAAQAALAAAALMAAR